MGLQKYRADVAGEKRDNGSIPWYTNWIGGPTLALIRNCPVTNAAIEPRTVYITGEPLTYSSLPASCKYRGITIKGVVLLKEGGYEFHCYSSSLSKIVK